MILFLIATVGYLGTLLVIRPAPASLKAAPLTFSENLKLIWASGFSGVLILLIFLITSDYGFLAINENAYALLSLNNDLEKASRWPVQAVTHLFIHANPLHLLVNVAGLGLASVYERRVGAQRFFAVLLVGSVASIPSIFFYPETATVSGISGGVFGLAAAYFTDQDELTLKEWFAAILLFAGLASVFALEGEFNSDASDAFDMQVDHIGHAMGAAGAIIYCRLKPKRSSG